MMRSLSSAVAGLNTQQTAMDVIGANISNVNTIGYKGSRASFQDVISQTMQSATASSGNRGGTNAIQIGMGVGLAGIDTMIETGSYQSTGKNTDLAIQNEGYFVVTDGKQQYYTRAGNFDFDAVGNFVIPGSGLQVKGWNATNGVLDNTGQITNIVVPSGKTIPATSTTEMTFINNLSASDTPGGVAQTSLEVYDSLGKTHVLSEKFIKIADNKWIAQASLTDGSAVTNGLREITFDETGKQKGVAQVTLAQTPATTINLDPAKYQLDNTANSVHTSYYTVGDNGVPPTLHVLSVEYTQTADKKWNYKIKDTADASATVLREGEITANAAGTTYTDNKAATPTFTILNGATTAVITLSLSSAGLAPVGSQFNADRATTDAAVYTTDALVNPLEFTPAGANKVSVALDFTDVTQYGTETTVQASEQNGSAAGTLESVSIDSSGKIIGKFTNGQTQDLAQVATATFTNPGGLNRSGGSLFVESGNSGFPSIGTSGTGSRGEIQAGTLEMSNIDLADQFSKMIITQRGFQSNSKIITVSDEMLEILANLKR
ncbi:MAG: flagellar hook protein FlgE [Negativicutes bacterium]